MMKKLQIGAVDMKKDSPMKNRGARNSIAVISNASPSLNTINSSIDIENVVRAENLTARKRSIFFQKMVDNVPRDGLLYN